MTVTIDYSRDELLSEFALDLLTKFYMKKGDKSPQDAYARAATAFSGGDEGLAQRIYDAVSKRWFMFASPVLSNAVLPGEKVKGLPISCFLTYVPDTLEGLIDHTAELRWLSVKGGGVGGHWSDVRSVSDIAPGPLPFLHTVDADMLAYRQGSTRKGSYAAYLDISHPDVIEFITIRVPTGDVGRKCLNLHNAVNLTDAFMEAVAAGADWDLIDPASKKVVETVKARMLWEALLETRYRTGEPYLNFIDTANRALPLTQKLLGLLIRGSNLCNEIHLATDAERTAVCCLSSLNLELYDEWQDSGLVADLIQFLDNVLQFFIDNCPDTLSRARYSAQRERSLGLGTLGWHSYLQRHMVAIESDEAKALNNEIFARIQGEAIAESLRLGTLKGEAPDMAGTGRRNAHLLAIAPNANSASLLGASPSIESWAACAFTQRSRAGSHLIKNVYLEQLLKELGQDTQEVWTSVITNSGSVQHLSFLTAHQKAVFKTAIEIDQMRIVELAADRQRFLCQGQSLNLFFKAGASRADLHKVHFAAWKLGCKGLYYLRTETTQKAENVSKKVERVALKDGAAFGDVKIVSKDGCPFCEKARQWFTKKGVSFTEIKKNDAAERQAFYAECGAGVQSVPQIFIDGERIGGYSDLIARFDPQQFETPAAASDKSNDECIACQG